MTGTSTFQDLIKGLEQEANLESIQLEEEAYTVLILDDGSALHIRYSHLDQAVVLMTDIGPISPETERPVCRELLKANYLWQGTGGATLSVLWEDEQIAMTQAIALDMLDPNRFVRWVEGFLQNAQVIRQRVEDISQLPPEDDIPGLESETEPPIEQTSPDNVEFRNLRFLA